jgi:hypothetical protein
VLALARRAAGGASRPPGADPVREAGFAVIVARAPVLGRTLAPHVIVRVEEPAPPDAAAACVGPLPGLGDAEPLGAPRPVEVDGRPAVRLDLRGRVDDESVRAAALCLVRDARAYVLVAQAPAAEFAAAAPALEAILGSFRAR